jgi:hypothetical protein
MNNAPNRPGATLEVPADLETIYANLVRISHSPSELVYDFAHLLPGTTNAKGELNRNVSTGSCCSAFG